jgi:hypothetical protein
MVLQRVHCEHLNVPALLNDGAAGARLDACHQEL